MQEYFLKLDYWLFDLLNQKGAFTYGDEFFPWVTDLHKNIYFKVVIVPLVLFLFLKIYKKKGALLFVVLLAAIGMSDFSGSVIKNQVVRQRPFENSEIIATQKSPAGSKSFYSNHASNMFTLATYTSQFVPQARIPFFLIAICIGYSRIYNGVHYPSDVLAGAIMGILWGYLFSLIAKKILQRLAHSKDHP
jgi:undecaprenyl-diphosphatase